MTFPKYDNDQITVFFSVLSAIQTDGKLNQPLHAPYDADAPYSQPLQSPHLLPQ